MNLPSLPLRDANADSHGVRAAAEGLVRYLGTHEAQKQLAFHGLRPVDPALAAESSVRFPAPKDLWSIADLGGWQQVQRQVLDTPAMAAATAPRR